MARVRKTRKEKRQHAIAEVLESRLLFSADALGPLAPLLMDDAVLDPLASLSLDHLSAPSVDDLQDIPIEELLPAANESDVADELRQDDLRQLAFVSADVPDAATVIQSLERSGIEVISIDADQDGLLVISQTLASRQGIDVVHVVSHGSSGSIALGSATLDSGSIEGNAQALQQWGDALSADADILFYGCELAAGSEGASLIERIASLTRADIAASSDLTGHSSKGGDWQLETTVGDVEADTFDDAELRASWAQTLATMNVTVFTDGAANLSLTVQDIVDRGAGADVTLREAIMAANNTPGDHTIILSTGAYSLSNNGTSEDSNQTGDLDINVNSGDRLTIRGAGPGLTTIDQITSDRVLDLNSGVLVLEDLQVFGGERGADGVGIYVNNGTFFTATNVEFNNNVASGSGEGGAIYNKGATILNDTVFIDNQAQYGGAIYNAGALAVDGGQLDTNNASKDGGGIYNEGATILTVTDVILNDNIADDKGGGIYNEGALELLRVTFDSNTSTNREGGGLFQQSDGLVATDVLFEGNTASGRGGGIDVRGDDATFTNVTFVNNSSGAKGGAVNMEGKNSTFINATFSENEADQGGAIRSDQDLVITNSTFYQNHDIDRAGAIWMENGKAVTLMNSVFDDNYSAVATNFTDIKGKVDSNGFNLFTTIAGTSFASTATTDIVVADMKLSALAVTTGYVPTHAPLPGSPVINAGGTPPLYTSDASNTNHDQLPDIGAHEATTLDGVIFWADDAGNIWRSNADFTNEQIIISGRPTDSLASRDIEVDMLNGRLYWLENNGTSWDVWTSTLDGTEAVSTLVTGLFLPKGIAIDPVGGRIYIIQGGAVGRIVSFNLVGGDGSNMDTDLVSNARDIEIDTINQNLIWTEDQGAGTQGRIMMMPLGSGLVQSVWEDNTLNQPDGLVLDTVANRIYFVDSATSTGFVIDYNAVLVAVSNGVSISTISGVLISTTNGVDGERLGYNTITNEVILASIVNNQIVVLDETFGSPINVATIAPPEALAVGVTTGIDDPPVVTISGPVVVFEGASALLGSSVFEVIDDYAADTQLSWQVLALPAYGQIMVNGVDLASLPVPERRFTQAMIEDGSVVSYVHDGVDTGGMDTFDVTVTDGQNTSSIMTVSVTVNNLPPFISANSALTVDEHLVTQITTAFLQTTDVSGPASLFYTVDPLNLPQHGRLLVNSVDILSLPPASWTFTQEDIDLGNVSYQQHQAGPDTASDFFGFTVSDGVTAATDTFTVLINNVNDIPAVTTAPLTVSENGNQLITTAILAGSDDDITDTPANLDYSVTGLPSGAEVQVFNSGSGLWVTGNAFTQQNVNDNHVRYVHNGGEPAPGTDQIALTLTDSQGLNVSDVIALNVTPANDAPTVITASLTVAENGNQLITTTILAGSDDDIADTPESLDYSVTGLPSGAEVQVFNSGSGLWVTGNAFTQQNVNDNHVRYVHNGGEPAPGTDQIALTLTDSQGSNVSDVIVLSITPTNDAPTLVTAPLTVPENGNQLITTVILAGSDDDIADSPENLDYSVTGLPSGAEVQVFNSGSGLWVTGNAFTQQNVNDNHVRYVHNGGEPAPGTDQIALTLTDSQGSNVSDVIVLSITPTNDAPTLVTAPLTVPENGNQLITTVILAGSDDDITDTPENLDYSVTGLPAGAEVQVFNSGSGLWVTGNAFTQQNVNDNHVRYVHNGGEPAPGTDQIALTLTDSQGLNVSDVIVLSISAVNDNPDISFNTLIINEGDAVALDSTWINLADSDHTIESLTIEISNAQFGILTLAGGNNGPATGVQFLNGELVYTHNGVSNSDDTITVKVTDPDGGITQAGMSIGLLADNDLPVVTPGVLVVAESGSAPLTTAHLLATDEETLDGDLLYQLATNALSEGELRDSNGNIRTSFSQQEVIDQEIHYHHFDREPAAETMEFELIDADDAHVTASLIIQIDAVNDAPVLLGSIAAQQATEGTPWSLQIDRSLWNDSDVGDSLTLSVSMADGQSVPAWLGFDAASGTLTGTPGNGDVGLLGIRINAQDQSGTAAPSVTFSLNVLNTNSAPYTLVLDNHQVAENASGARIGMLSAIDVDERDQLTFSVDDARFEVRGNELYLKPEVVLDFEKETTVSVEIKVVDTAGASLSKVVVLSVVDRNDAPELATLPVAAPNAEGGIFQIPVDTFVDFDGDQISYSATQASGEALPVWLEFRSSTQEFVLIDASAASEQLAVLLIADDGRGGLAETALLLRFEPVIVAAEPEPEPVIDAPQAIDIPTTQLPDANDSAPESDVEEEIETAVELLPDNYGSTEIAVEEVDLQSLITPLPQLGTLDLASSDNITAPHFDLDQLENDVEDIDAIDLAALLSMPEQNVSSDYAELVDALDRQREKLAEEATFAQTLVGGTVGITSGLSLGYLVWLIRGGTLMGSMLSSLPAWRFVDPLPVLASLGDTDDVDDESLESMVGQDDESEALNAR